MKDRLTLKQYIVGNALRVMVGFERRRFEKSCRNARAVQERVLLEILARNSSSDFGKRCGFSKIRSIEDFQKAVPVAEYEDFRPYIDRVIGGDKEALFGPREKFVMCTRTSGTTGKPKYIPVTKTFISRYRKGWRLWGSYLLRTYPTCFARKIMFCASPLIEKNMEGGIPCGAVSGLIVDIQSTVLKENYALPLAINRVKDIDLKLYLGMRIAVPQNVGSFLTANPSTILQHVQRADEKKEDIIRDIADGTCKGIERIEGGIRQDILPYVRKDVKEARRLDRIVKESGRLYPRDYWPELDFLACWKGGPLKTYVSSLRRYFNDTPIRDIGLMATEGRMTIPMDDGAAAGPLDVENRFFEFISEESIDEAPAPVLLADELEMGKRYFILLTTWAGLYRYNVSDVVEVTDFFYNNPVLRYVNKGSHFLNVMGENVSEYQVVSAMGAVKKKLGLEFENFSLAASIGGGPYYCILIEKGKIEEGRMEERMLAEFDATLRFLNIEYNKRRRTRRLKPVRLLIIAEKSFDNVREQFSEKGPGRLEQFKHRYLINDNNLLKRFTVLEEKVIND